MPPPSEDFKITNALILGLIAGWFVIGEDLKHSIYAIAGTYLILIAAGGTLLSVIISFIFNFGYLLVGMIAFSIDNNPLVI